MTTEVSSPYFEIDEKVLKDDSIKEMEDIEYLPRNVSDINKSSKIIIDTKDLDVFMLPHKACLEVRGKITQNDAANTAFGVNDVVSLVNNGWSLFSSAELYLNDRAVETILDTLPQASTILNAATFSDDYNRSTASNMFWYKDTAEGDIKIGPVKVAGDSDSNKAAIEELQKGDKANMGFKARFLLTRGSNQICLFLPLSSIFGFCRDVTTVTRGIKLSIHLTRNVPNDYIMRDAAPGDAKFVFNHVSLWMPKVVPTVKYEALLNEKLLSNFTKQIYFEEMNVYTSTFASTDISPTWRVTTKDTLQRPRHILVAFQSVARLNDQLRNAQVFDNANLKSIYAMVNSRKYPEYPIECDFNEATRNYSRAYRLFQNVLDKYQDVDTGTSVSVEDFASLYPIFHIDVSKHDNQLFYNSAEIALRWTLGGSFQFGGANTRYRVIAVILNDRFIEVNAVDGKMSLTI